MKYHSRLVWNKFFNPRRHEWLLTRHSRIWIDMKFGFQLDNSRIALKFSLVYEYLFALSTIIRKRWTSFDKMIDRDPNKKVEKLERIDAYWVKSTIEITVIFLSKLLMPITKKKINWEKWNTSKNYKRNLKIQYLIWKFNKNPLNKSYLTHKFRKKSSSIKNKINLKRFKEEKKK